MNPHTITTQHLDSKNAKNTKILTTSGDAIFGVMPQLSPDLPEGNIILKLGDSGFYDRHTKQVKSAFGLRHIWDKHRIEIVASNATEIVVFIESIITNVIIDNSKSKDKPLIVKSNMGIVVVELKTPQNEPPHYSIITAYTRKSHPGTLMASL